MANKESVQKRLQKVRPPRVQMTYDVEIGDAIEKQGAALRRRRARRLPAATAATAAAAAEGPQLRQRRRRQLRRGDEGRGAARPRSGSQNRLGAGGGEFAVELAFRAMDDFRPESVVHQVEPLRKLLEARTKLADLRNKLAGNDRLEDMLSEVLGQHREARRARPRGRKDRGMNAVAPQELATSGLATLEAAPAALPATLLDQIVEQSRVANSTTEHARARDLIAELVGEVMDGTVVVSDNLGATLDARVAELDALISEQLGAVMHAPEFQKLEASWTGLHYLCKNTSTGRA